MRGYIHHIEWCVSRLDELTDQLVGQFGFRVISERSATQRDSFLVRQRVLKSGLTQFILTEKKTLSQQPNGCAHTNSNGCTNNDVSDSDVSNSDISSNSLDLQHDESVYPLLTCCRNSHQIDSVFNVCLEVSDVDTLTKNILAANSQYPRAQASVIIPPNSIKVKSNAGDSEVSIRYSVVQSPCGNVIHTLINTQEYKTNSGLPFLPGFIDVKSDDVYTEEEMSLSTTHMDHVTYVCETNQSHHILKWYKTCFGMQPFQITSMSAGDQQEIEANDEAKEKAQFSLATVDIHEEVGMKMTVGEWITSWMCRENGVQFPEVDEVLNFKLVLAEPLEKDSDSHVQHFLDSHGGPGLQHIGLTAPNVAKTVEWMHQRGAKFRTPPPTYYQLEHKRQEILSAQEDIEKFRSLGLLLDSEADIDIEDGIQDRFLIQIFTRPLFYPPQNTFFLEILERRGARGFGAGNITALARSIILQQQQEEEAQRKTVS